MFAQESVMGVEKEREAFEAYMAEKYKNLMDRRQCLNNGGGYMAWDMNVAWQVWQAKAQAVPEGFVLVERVHPDAIVHNQGLGLFKECQVIYGWAGKSKDFKEALNKGFYHGVKLGAKAVLETAMIEPQEPTND